MASYTTPRIFGYLAGADLSAAQFKFVKFGAADDTVVLNTTAGGGVGTIVGVLMNTPIATEIAEVAMPNGGAKVKLAGTVTRGGRVESDASGNAVAVSSGAGVATALMSGVTGDVIAIELS